MPLRLLAAVVLLLAAGCSSDSDDSSGTPEPSAGGPTSSAPAGGGTSLRIAGFDYSPDPLTVAPGASIAVSNSDSALHTVTSRTSGLFDVSAEKGSPATLTAPSKAGTYEFFCTVHPTMKGTLVVTG